MEENTIPRKAVVLGGTGLIGGELIKLLIENNSYTEIRVLGRRNVDIASSKIHFFKVDMENLLQHESLFKVDDVFCCLGTTIKTAGSKEAFRKVDYEMVVNAAKATESHPCEGRDQQFIMISSLGANTQVSSFYLRTKGETEKAVLETNIHSISILRPSILFGNRVEKRAGEKIGISFMKFATPILQGSLKKYRGIEAKTVAEAMIIYALAAKKGKFIYESLEIEGMVHIGL